MSISRYTDENYGSLLRIQYAAAWKFSAFNLSARGKIALSGISFSGGFTWEDLFCSEDTKGHQQTQANDNNGESWQQQVVGFVPGDEDAIEDGLLALTNERYVVMITRPNGLIKIVGTPLQPLDFKLDSNSQNTVPNTAGTAVTFSAITSHRALILLDSLPG